MKVLPLVLVLLVVIALAVREEINMFKVEKKGRIAYLQQHLNFRESSYLREAEKTPKPRLVEKGEKKEGTKLEPGTRELNIFPLVDPTEYDKDPKKAEYLLQIVQRLVEAHFKESPLYRELIAEDPQLIPHLFEAIREKCSAMDFKFGKAGWSDLALLKLEDENLQFFLYEFLKGERMSPLLVRKAYQDKKKIPLMNSLTIEKKSRPLRLFIASPPLLEALGEDVDVDSLLAKRERLSKLLKKNKAEKPALDREWEEALKESGMNLSSLFVSYEISSTKI